MGSSFPGFRASRRSRVQEVLGFSDVYIYIYMYIYIYIYTYIYIHTYIHI